MLFDIVNPSDPYTFRANTLEIATVAMVLLGRGQYGANLLDAEGQEGEEVAKSKEGVPVFLFGGHDEWCTERFGADLSTIIKRAIDGRTDLVATLRSVVIGRGVQERRDFDQALAGIEESKRAEWVVARHEDRRSSMNDIGGRALRQADEIEKAGLAASIEKAPQQVFGR